MVPTMSQAVVSVKGRKTALFRPRMHANRFRVNHY